MVVFDKELMNRQCTCDEVEDNKCNYLFINGEFNKYNVARRVSVLSEIINKLGFRTMEASNEYNSWDAIKFDNDEVLYVYLNITKDNKGKVSPTMYCIIVGNVQDELGNSEQRVESITLNGKDLDYDGYIDLINKLIDKFNIEISLLGIKNGTEVSGNTFKDGEFLKFIGIVTDKRYNNANKKLEVDIEVTKSKYNEYIGTQATLSEEYGAIVINSQSTK